MCILVASMCTYLATNYRNRERHQFRDCYFLCVSRFPFSIWFDLCESGRRIADHRNRSSRAATCMLLPWTLDCRCGTANYQNDLPAAIKLGLEQGRATFSE